MNRTKKNAKQPDTNEANDILLSDPLQIAYAFNSYFVNIGPNLAGKIKIPKHSNHKVYLKEKYTNTFEFTKVDELEVNSIIDHLSPNTSYGFDGISTILLKQCKKAIDDFRGACAFKGNGAVAGHVKRVDHDDVFDALLFREETLTRHYFKLKLDFSWGIRSNMGKTEGIFLNFQCNVT